MRPRLPRTCPKSASVGRISGPGAILRQLLGPAQWQQHKSAITVPVWSAGIPHARAYVCVMSMCRPAKTWPRVGVSEVDRCRSNLARHQRVGAELRPHLPAFSAALATCGLLRLNVRAHCPTSGQIMFPAKLGRHRAGIVPVRPKIRPTPGKTKSADAWASRDGLGPFRCRLDHGRF